MGKKRVLQSHTISAWSCDECKGVHIGMYDTEGNLLCMGALDPEEARDLAADIFEVADKLDPDGADEIGQTVGTA